MERQLLDGSELRLAAPFQYGGFRAMSAVRERVFRNPLSLSTRAELHFSEKCEHGFLLSTSRSAVRK